MTRLLFSIILTISLFQCMGQNTNARLVTSGNKCTGSWQYFSLQDTTYGEVLFHAKADALCGAIATASLTVIKTNLGDTIRVLEMCNVGKDFKKLSRVKIAPFQQPAFGVMLPHDKNYDCLVSKTCYGFITPLDK